MNYSIHRVDRDGNVNPDVMAEETTLENALSTAKELGGKCAIISSEGEVLGENGRAMDVDIPWLNPEAEAAPAPAKVKAAKAEKEEKPKAKSSSRVKPKTSAAKEEAKAAKTREDSTEKVSEAKPIDPLDVLDEVLNPKPAEETAPTPAPAKTEAPARGKIKEVGHVSAEDAGDFLMWIGSSSSTTIDEFLASAKRRGVAKKVSKLPYDLVIGVSRMFLVHDEAVPANAVIFGSYVISGVQVAVADIDNPDLPEKLEGDKRIEVVLASERMPEGIYVLGKKVDVFERCFDYNTLFHKAGQRFRGYKRVDAVGILNSEAYKERPTVQPKATVVLPEGYTRPKEGDQWTEEERQALMEHVKDRNNDRSQAFREFSEATGRSREAVSYQYYRFLRNSSAIR